VIEMIEIMQGNRPDLELSEAGRKRDFDQFDRNKIDVIAENPFK